MKQIRNDFEALYRKYARRVYRYILTLCRDEAQAEDILSMTFLRAIENSDSFAGRCEISTWLCRIAHNIWLDERKRKENQHAPYEEACGEGQAPGVEETVIDRVYAAEWLTQIHCLPPPYGEVFLLRVVEEKSYREIGNSFGKSENWARVTYYRAKQKVRACIPQGERKGESE